MLGALVRAEVVPLDYNGTYRESYDPYTETSQDFVIDPLDAVQEALGPEFQGLSEEELIEALLEKSEADPEELAEFLPFLASALPAIGSALLPAITSALPAIGQAAAPLISNAVGTLAGSVLPKIAGGAIQGLTGGAGPQGALAGAAMSAAQEIPKLLTGLLQPQPALPAPAQRVSEGDAIKGDSTPEVYRIEGGRRRWIPNPDTLFALGYTWGQVRTLPQNEVSQIPLGEPIPPTIRRPPAVIPGGVPWLRPQIPPPQPVPRLLGDIMRSITRLEGMLQQMQQTLAQRAAPKPKVKGKRGRTRQAARPAAAPAERPAAEKLGTLFSNPAVWTSLRSALAGPEAGSRQVLVQNGPVPTPVDVGAVLNTVGQVVQQAAAEHTTATEGGEESLPEYLVDSATGEPIVDDPASLELRAEALTELLEEANQYQQYQYRRRARTTNSVPRGRPSQGERPRRSRIIDDGDSGDGDFVNVGGRRILDG